MSDGMKPTPGSTGKLVSCIGKYFSLGSTSLSFSYGSSRLVPGLMNTLTEFLGIRSSAVRPWTIPKPISSTSVSTSRIAVTIGTICFFLSWLPTNLLGALMMIITFAASSFSLWYSRSCARAAERFSRSGSILFPSLSTGHVVISISARPSVEYAVHCRLPFRAACAANRGTEINQGPLPPLPTHTAAMASSQLGTSCSYRCCPNCSATTSSAITVAFVTFPTRIFITSF